MDFFSILLPGALLTYLLMGEVGPAILGYEKYQAITGAEAVAVFIVTSYLLGHIVFLLGAWWLDELYDWVRRYTLNKQIVLLARRGRLLSRLERALIWLLFKRERNLAVDRAGKIKEKMLKGLGAKNADVVAIAAGAPQRITNVGTADLVFLCVCTPSFRKETYLNLKSEGS